MFPNVCTASVIVEEICFFNFRWVLMERKDFGGSVSISGKLGFAGVRAFWKQCLHKAVDKETEEHTCQSDCTDG